MKKITVLDNQWDVKYRAELQGVIAFIKWKIPQKEALSKCYKLTFILGVSPTLGSNMYYMFYEASSFNQPFQRWDTRSVTDMRWMFNGASSFNQPLQRWDTSSVTDMRWMFNGASSFNQPLWRWDTRSVTDMGDMFYKASSFNQPLNSWDTSSVTDMSYMFEDSAMKSLPSWYKR